MSSVGAISHLLYLHGFRSSPKSFKARYMADWLQRHRPDVHWWCPQLPPSPREAMDLVFAEIGHWPPERMGVIGSSLWKGDLKIARQPSASRSWTRYPVKKEWQNWQFSMASCLPSIGSLSSVASPSTAAGMLSAR